MGNWFTAAEASYWNDHFSLEKKGFFINISPVYRGKGELLFFQFIVFYNLFRIPDKKLLDSIMKVLCMLLYAHIIKPLNPIILVVGWMI